MNISQLNQPQTSHPQKDLQQTEITPDNLQTFRGELIFAENELSLFRANREAGEDHRSHLEEVEKKRDNDDQEKKIALTQWQSKAVDAESREDVVLQEFGRESVYASLKQKTNSQEQAISSSASKKALNQAISQEKLQIQKPHLNSPIVQQVPGEVPSQDFTEIIQQQQDSGQQKASLNLAKPVTPEQSPVTEFMKQFVHPGLQRLDRAATDLKPVMDRSVAENRQPLPNSIKKDGNTADLKFGRERKDPVLAVQRQDKNVTDKRERFTNEFSTALKHEQQVEAKSVTEAKQDQTAKAKNLSTVVDNVRIMLSSGKDTIVIRLMPEHLGKLEIKLKKSGQNLVGEFKVDSVEAKELLTAEFQQLEQDLESQGIKLEKFTIRVRGEETVTPAVVSAERTIVEESPALVKKSKSSSNFELAGDDAESIALADNNSSGLNITI